ncbi:MAG: hypothetical protein ABR562_03660, partial [Thermoplasmatota archaeon]
MVLCDPGQGEAREGTSLPFKVQWQPSTDNPTMGGSVAVASVHVEDVTFATAIGLDGSLGPTFAIPAGATPSLAAMSLV